MVGSGEEAVEPFNAGGNSTNAAFYFSHSSTHFDQLFTYVRSLELSRTLNKHDDDDRENIVKCNFTFPQSLLDHSKSRLACEMSTTILEWTCCEWFGDKMKETIIVCRQMFASSTQFQNRLFYTPDRATTAARMSRIRVESVQNCCVSLLIGSLSKHDVGGSENVIWKCNFTFLQSFFNYYKSSCLKNVFYLFWN